MALLVCSEDLATLRHHLCVEDFAGSSADGQCV